MIGTFDVNYQVTESEAGGSWRASVNVLVPDLRLGVVGLSMAADPRNALVSALVAALFKIKHEWPTERYDRGEDQGSDQRRQGHGG